MEILVKRKWYSATTTIGEMYLDGSGEREAFTLEDCVRGMKIQGKTAIPEGRYQIVLNYSDRFKRVMPRLLDVPGFKGVLIHSGNTHEDTEGCLLVGKTLVNSEFIGESRGAFTNLFVKLEEGNRHGKIWIEIVNTRSPRVDTPVVV